MSTTSAAPIASRGEFVDDHVADANGRECDLGQGPGALRARVEDVEMAAGQQPAEHGQVRPALDAGADDRDVGSAFVRAGAGSEVTDRDAADRGRALGGDRPAVEHRDGHARFRVVEHHDRADGGDAERVVRREPGDPLHAHQVLVLRIRAEVRRHRVDEGVRRSRVDGDLWRQLARARRREGGHRPFGEPQPLLERGHRGNHVRRTEPAERGQGHRAIVGMPGCRSSTSVTRD